MTKIAFLGLGAMGSRMAARLLAAGNEVTVWNRSAAPAQALAAQGAGLADSPRAAASGADVVIAMLRDDEVSQQVWQDAETGALAGLRHGALAIDCSTLTPARAKAWAGAVQAAGGRAVEAPVSGSRPQAQSGALVFFLAGDTPDTAQSAKILAPLGAKFHAVGPIGAAAVVKLVTNTMLAVQVAAWSELLPLMQAQALDLEAALAALSSTSAWAPVAGYLTMLMRTGDHAPQFPIELVHKDMRYVTSLADAGALPLANLLRNRFGEGIAKGLGGENMSALVKLSQG